MINNSQIAILKSLLYAHEKDGINYLKWFVYGGNLVYKTGRGNKYFAFIYNGGKQPEEIPLKQFDIYNSDFCNRKLNALTDKDRNRIGKVNAKNGYGMSKQQLEYVLKQHYKAMIEEDYHKMICQEYRLTDINYHAECGLMACGLHSKALEIM